MFLGDHPYKVDDKGRVPFPSKFKEELKAGVVLARGQDRCIAVYPVAEWSKLADQMGVLPPSPTNKRRMARFLFGKAFAAELDGQGRIALPASLRQYACIEHGAVVVGVNNFIEVWDEGAWEEESARSAMEAERQGEDGEQG